MSLLQLQIIWHNALLYSRSASNLWRSYNIIILCFLFIIILDTLHKTLPTCSAIMKLQFMFMQYIQVEIFFKLLQIF